MRLTETVAGYVSSLPSLSRDDVIKLAGARPRAAKERELPAYSRSRRSATTGP